jgi:hypothetical protein
VVNSELETSAVSGEGTDGRLRIIHPIGFPSCSIYRRIPQPIERCIIQGQPISHCHFERSRIIRECG